MASEARFRYETVRYELDSFFKLFFTLLGVRVYVKGDGFCSRARHLSQRS